jgi:hypothetical protein
MVFVKNSMRDGQKISLLRVYIHNSRTHTECGYIRNSSPSSYHLFPVLKQTLLAYKCNRWQQMTARRKQQWNDITEDRLLLTKNKKCDTQCKASTVAEDYVEKWWDRGTNKSELFLWELKIKMSNIILHGKLILWTKIHNFTHQFHTNSFYF